MRVYGLTLRHLFNHDSTDLELPERGVVVVTGSNHSGKSSLVEGVAVAGWGKTLRGTPPWNANGVSSLAGVQVAGGLDIARTKTQKGSPKLSFSRNGHTDEYANPTKAQEALESIIGSFDVWRRSHVFSSSDAAHFTLASDKTRKELIETLVGIGGKFGGALKDCREDLTVAKREWANCSREADRLDQKLQSEQRRLDEARESVAKLRKQIEQPDSDEQPQEQGESADEIKKLLNDAVRTAESVSKKLRAGASESGSRDAEATELARRVEMLDGDKCPTCGQDIPEDVRAKLDQELETLQEIVEEAQAESADVATALRHELKDLEATRMRLTHDLRRASNAGARQQVEDRNREAWEKQIEDREKIVADATHNLKKLNVEADGANDELEMCEEDLGELRACEQVLGLKGPRTQVLGKALAGIEVVANAWLERLACKGMSLRLASSRELKKGGVTDEVSLEVDGAGGGYGYKASSGGERRRIDLALLFALGEVAGAAHGKSHGTLWLDEIMDGLDDEGREAALQVIEELAQERCVVVITHAPAFAEQLTAAMRLQVKEGKVYA